MKNFVEWTEKNLVIIAYVGVIVLVPFTVWLNL